MIHPRWMMGPGWKSNPYFGNKLAQKIAKQYAKAVGFPPVQRTPYVEINPQVSVAIATFFHNTPDQSDDPVVRRAYKDLAREVNVQFDIVSRYVLFEPHGDEFQPYKSSEEMMNDLLRNRHLWVYTGGEDHALLSREENWRFRAIHDFFGHAAQGFSFGPRGEENAWIEHCKIFAPVARTALTTETRGQNSWFNFGPYANLPPNKRPFAEQKAIILPKPYLMHPVFAAAYARWPGFLN